MDKSPDAFRTISEVADVLETPAHVLRFWESRFPQIKPVKRAGGRRYYRPSDVALLSGIKRLLHDEGLTIRGVQKILRDQGIKHVAGLSGDADALADIIPATADLDEAALLAALEGNGDDIVVSRDTGPLSLTEAAYGAFDDPEEDALPVPVPGDQPDLPLFPVTRSAPSTPSVILRENRAPRSRSDVNLASLARRLTSGAAAQAQPELGLLAQRLARLRALVGNRAEGSQS